MSGFVYRWHDNSNGMYYIGSHKGMPNDNYIGSGVYFKRAFKQRPECFSREILYQGNDYLELEEFILEELDAMNDSKSYNLKNAAIGGTLDDSVSDKQRKKLSGITLSKETKDSISYSKTKYSLFCSYNNKTYKNAYEASKDLGYSDNHIRYMSKLTGDKNHLGLIRIKKI